MTFTYDPSTDLGRVRLVVRDTDSENPLFSDEELDAFLEMEGGTVKQAAAAVLDAMASDEALVLKRVRVMGLQTDGPAVAAALRRHAVTLREQAAREAIAQGEEAPSFDWAELVLDPFSEREYRWKQGRRYGQK